MTKRYLLTCLLALAAAGAQANVGLSKIPGVQGDGRITLYYPTIVAGVPAAADFDHASLATPGVPLGLVTAGQDKWLAPRFHSGPVLKSCNL